MARVSVAVCTGLLVIIIAAAPAACAPSRVKDIAVLVGLGKHRLLGYGLVVGLAGTGDSDTSQLTTRSIANMLETFGVTVSAGDFKARNVAAVMVTADLPASVEVGSSFDVTVSSLAEAKSLQGGTLLLTPLRAGNDEVYAVAQGPVTVGGFAVETKSGDGAQKNHVTVGRVANGASATKPLTAETAAGDTLSFCLLQPDFTTAWRLAEAVNANLGRPLATATDQATVRVTVPAESRGDVTALIVALENVPVEPDSPARVVINERTGTVVIGSRVRLSPVAVCHGGLTVEVRSETQVSQPPPLVSAESGAAGATIDPAGRPPTPPDVTTGGQTVVVRQDELKVKESAAALAQIPEQATLDDLVRALNALQVKPRDLIAILQALKEAGALQAELVTL